MFLHKSKKPNGRIYYQIAENYRENGKVKRRILKHIGPAEKLLTMNMGGVTLDSVYIKNVSDVEFGASFALNEICDELKVEKHVDKYIKRQPDLLKLGKVMKLASIHRCIKPRGYNDISSWLDDSILKHTEKVKPDDLKKQNLNLWLDNFDEKTVDNIQTSLSRSITKKVKPDLSRIIIDFTNVDTYQQLINEDQLAQKGKPKSGNKRSVQINYALVCSNDGIPLHHAIYNGNENDSDFFKIFSKHVLKKYGTFFKQEENLVIVFDRGMNSEDAIVPIAKDYKFIGAVKISECKDVCKDISKYKCVSKDKKGLVISYHEFKITKYGESFRGIASYHEKTAKLIEHGYEDKIKKVKKELKIAKSKLNGPHWKDKNKVEARVNRHLKKYKVTALFDILIGTKDCKLFFKKCDFKKDEFEKIKKTWGISFLFTNLKRMNPKKIIDIYFREKNIVEDCNKMLKDVDFCRIGPVRCWIDEHIRAHFLRTTIALAIGRILAKKVNKKIRQKWKPSTIVDYLKKLNVVKVTIMPFGKNDFALSNYDSNSKILFDSLRLKQNFKEIKKSLK